MAVESKTDEDLDLSNSPQAWERFVIVLNELHLEADHSSRPTKLRFPTGVVAKRSTALQMPSSVQIAYVWAYFL